MSDVSNLRDTIIPKSDQLNADDLIGASKTIKVTGVSRGGVQDPVFIHYEGDDGRPYKPCKSMRRVLIFAWGENGNNWIGKSMTLFCDPDVMYGGHKVGGIRISHLSDIRAPISLKLTSTRSKRTEFNVQVLSASDVGQYPSDKFDEGFPKMRELIESGKNTCEQVIAMAETRGRLTSEQRQRIRECSSCEEEDAKIESDYLASKVAQSTGSEKSNQASEKQHEPTEDELFGEDK